MKKRLFMLLAVFVLSFATIPAMAAVEGLQGEGTKDNPYTIGNLEELVWFRDDVNAGDSYIGKYVELTESIDLANQEWTPIKTFSGTFDGGNKIVSNLKITHPGTEVVVNEVGFFGKISEGVVKNLVIENASVTGSGYVGAVVGNSYTGTVSGVTVKGNINIAGYQYVGGVSGYGYANMTDCHVIGDGAETSCIKKVAKSEIYGSGTNGYVGGVRGWTGEGNTVISGCSVKNITITTNDDTVGGVCGILHYGNSYTDCVLDAVVITAPMNDGYNGIIAGHIIRSAGTTQSYSITVSNLTATAEGNELPVIGTGAGAVICDNAGDTLSGTVYYSLEEALAAAEAGDTITLLRSSSNAVTIPDGVKIDANGYTYVVDSDLSISTADELKAFAAAVNAGNSYEGKTVTLTADIDLEYTAVVIGTKANSFKGTFDGLNHVVSNLNIYEDGSESDYFADSDDYLGLFGCINTPAVVKNVTVHDPYIVGSSYVAGVVGCAYTGTVSNCHVTGEIDIEGKYMVGGITGQGYAKITGCSVIGDEDWDYSYIGAEYEADSLEGDNVGGIVGHHAENSTLADCTVKNVTVAGTRKVGGVIGTAFQNNKISGCVVDNVIVTTNATEEYASGNKSSMAIGGIIGMTSSNYSGGYVTDCRVSNLTLTAENELTTAVSAGAITGGERGIVAPENTTYDNNKAINVKGANNSYLVSPELPTATVTEIPESELNADVPLTFALKFFADEVTPEQLAYYGDWYADFELTLNKTAIFDDNDSTANGYLAGEYGTYGWVTVPFTPVTLEANKSLKIMEYASELMGKPGLKYTYREVYEAVKEFNCGVYFKDLFLANNKDLEVTLELRMYNPEDETESYTIGETYKFSGKGEYIFGYTPFVVRNMPIKQYKNDKGETVDHCEVAFFAGIDSLDYKTIGFKVEAYNGETTVWDEIPAVDKDGKYYVYKDITVTGSEGSQTVTAEKIDSYRIFGIQVPFEKSVYDDKDVWFTPYAENFDGTKTYGLRYSLPDIYTK